MNSIQVMPGNSSRIPLAGSGKTVKLAFYKDPFHESRIGEELFISGDALADIDAGSYNTVQTIDVTGLYSGEEIPDEGLTVYVRAWVEDTQEPNVYNKDSFLTFKGLLTRNNGEKLTMDTTLEENTNDGGSYSGGGTAGGTTVSAYNVETKATTHGTVRADKTSAASGDAITLTVTPDTGYKVESVTVMDSGGNTVSLTENSAGTYSFTMPARSVTADAVFVPAEAEQTGTEQSGGQTETHSGTGAMDGFTDLDDNAWYHDGVEYVLEKGVMNGVSDGSFAPNVPTSRAMLVSMLWRLEGRPEAKADLSSYADGDQVSAWAGDALGWAVGTGIITGMDGNRLSSGTNATRAQVATMLLRFDNLTK